MSDLLIPPDVWSSVFDVLCEEIQPSSTMSGPAGVYFIIQDGRVIYVGQSRRVAIRCRQSIQRFGPARVMCLEVPRWQAARHWLRDLEAAAIRFFEPKHNIDRPEPSSLARGMVGATLWRALPFDEAAARNRFYSELARRAA